MSSTELTFEQFERALPKSLRTSLKPEMVANINGLIKDPFIRDAYRENLISYTSVMKDGRFKMHQYIDAVRYVSFKLLGSSNIDAFTKTFPDRMQAFIDSGTTDKDIASYVASYNKNKLVNLILEQTVVPSHVLNADMYQNALNVQASLMVSATSEKVRTDAANSLLTHLKVPESTKIELDVSVRDSKSIDELREATMRLVAQEKAMMLSGASTVESVAHRTIIDITPTEVEE